MFLEPKRLCKIRELRYFHSKRSRNVVTTCLAFVSSRLFLGLVSSDSASTSGNKPTSLIFRGPKRIVAVSPTQYVSPKAER